MSQPNRKFLLRGHVRRLGLTLGVAALVAPLSAAAFGGAAQAAVGACRSDPVVVLSNLKTLDLSASVSDSSNDLQSVNYTLHLPPGVRPLLVIPTDGLVGQVEHFTYVNDQTAGSYAETTEALTGESVSVTASALGILIGSGHASGLSNSPITIVLHPGLL